MKSRIAIILWAIFVWVVGAVIVGYFDFGWLVIGLIMVAETLAILIPIKARADLSAPSRK